MNPRGKASEQFKPSAGTSIGGRRRCLKKYIRYAKTDLAALAPDWNAPAWPGVGVFNKIGSGTGGKALKATAPTQLMDSRFIEFAKAYIRELHSRNPLESPAHHTARLRALRLIEKALMQTHGQADPVAIDEDILNSACELANDTFRRSTIYMAGREIAAIATTLVSKGIVSSQLQGWQPAVRQRRRLGNAVGSEGDKARTGRLPSPAAIEALGVIFNLRLEARDPRAQRDIATTSGVALLLSAPSRGQEIHRLPSCLQFRATDRFGAEHLGLRLEASKGFGAYVKWVWTGMVPVVERALDRLLAITAEPRRLALHLEDPKTRELFFRHAQCPDVGEDEALTSHEVCQALGLSEGNAAGSMRSAGVGPAKRNRPYTLRSLWHEWVLPRHRANCPYFPYVSKKDRQLGKKGGLKFSQALFCMVRHQLHARNKANPVLLWMPDLNDFGKDLAPSSARMANIFERHGYGEESPPLRLRSHQFRILLNTEAQRMSMPDDMIAVWSGRVQSRQNRNYDERREQERTDQSRPAIESLDKRLSQPRAEDSSQIRRQGHWIVDSSRPPRSIADGQDAQPRLTGLQTLFGECHHDWAATPCEGYVHCLECDEHECEKREDAIGQANLKQIQAHQARVLLEIEKSKREIDEKTWGASAWGSLQERKARKLAELLKLLTDPKLPEGSRIKTANTRHPTHMHRVLRSISLQALEENLAPEDTISRLLSALCDKEGGQAEIMVVLPRRLAAK